MVATVEGQRKTVMRQTLAAQALIRAGLFHELYRAFFQHAGADAAENVFLADAVENDGLDTGFRQKLAKQQPRWTGADDDDLCTHCFLPNLSPVKKLTKRCRKLNGLSGP